MTDTILWGLFGAAGIAIWQWVEYVRTQLQTHRSDLDRALAEIESLRTEISSLSTEVDRATLTPAQQEIKHFANLPPLTSAATAKLQTGDALSLLLQTFTEQGFPIIYSVEYVHGNMTYSSSSQKDTVAYGKARFEHTEDFKDVRILFSQLNATATLCGLALEGNVKEDA